MVALAFFSALEGGVRMIIDESIAVGEYMFYLK